MTSKERELYIGNEISTKSLQSSSLGYTLLERGFTPHDPTVTQRATHAPSMDTSMPRNARARRDQKDCRLYTCTRIRMAHIGLDSTSKATTASAGLAPAQCVNKKERQSTTCLGE
eukprot:1763795-Alexandrium_andersonii.AAC.1